MLPQVKCNDRDLVLPRGQYQRLGVQRIVYAIRRTALPIGIAVHRTVERWRDIDGGHTRAKWRFLRVYGGSQQHRNQHLAEHVFQIYHSPCRSYELAYAFHR